MQCPKCKLHNPEGAMRCDCGYDFDTMKMDDSYLPNKTRRRKPTPEETFKFTYWLVFITGGISFVLGLLSVLFDAEILKDFGSGYVNIALGALILLLGFFVHRKSIPALIITICLYCLNAVSLILSYFMQISNLSLRPLVINILIIVILIQGAKAIRTLKQEKLETTDTVAQ